MESQGGLPRWLSKLMEETFFIVCGTHERLKQNEKNLFCLNCCISICPCCVRSHPFHLLLQVRRFLYNDVVKLDDLQKLIDCSFVQTYTTNNAKVIFLRPKHQSRISKSSDNSCLTCGKILPGHFHYCNLTCKVEHMVSQGIDISSMLFQFDASELALTKFENLQMDDSDLPKDEVFSGSSIKEMGESSKKSDEKKPSHRRKGSPHRAPLR